MRVSSLVWSLLAPLGNTGEDDTEDERIQLAETDVELKLDFGISIRGTGLGPRIGAIDISNAAGAVEIDGSIYSVVLHERIPWPEQDFVLYQALAIQADQWYAIWFYCRGNVLEGLYSEGVHTARLRYNQVEDGTCSHGLRPTTTRVQLPAIDMAAPAFEPGISVEGSQISVSGDRGWVQLGSTEMEVFPFEVVDCGECDEGDGWLELHVLLQDARNGRACFGIFYFYPYWPKTVVLEYTLSLPDLTPATIDRVTAFDAIWAVSPGLR